MTQQSFDTHYHRAALLARLLDAQFGVGRFRIGLDPILGLIPGIGDAAVGIASLYILWLAHQAEVPKHILGLMVMHIGVDLSIGLVPVAGDVFDALYKANTKNLRLLEKHAALTVR